MRFHAASKKEIKGMLRAMSVCLIGMLSAFFLLSRIGIGVFDYRIMLGGILGTGMAVANFAALCLTLQIAAGTENKSRMQAKLQLSYSCRLVLQAVWVATAFLLPWMHGVAASLPLLFPGMIILIRRKAGGER